MVNPISVPRFLPLWKVHFVWSLNTWFLLEVLFQEIWDVQACWRKHDTGHELGFKNLKLLLLSVDCDSGLWSKIWAYILLQLPCLPSAVVIFNCKPNNIFLLYLAMPIIFFSQKQKTNNTPFTLGFQKEPNGSAE